MNLTPTACRYELPSPRFTIVNDTCRHEVSPRPNLAHPRARRHGLSQPQGHPNTHFDQEFSRSSRTVREPNTPPDLFCSTAMEVRS